MVDYNSPLLSSIYPGMMPTPVAPTGAAPSDAIQAAMAATLGTIQLPNAGPSPTPTAAAASAPDTPAKGKLTMAATVGNGHHSTP